METTATKEALLEQFEVLQTTYIRLLNDKDVLLQWGKPQLEALYATRIGVHRLEELKLQLLVKALRRKCELVRSRIARGLPVIPEVIEAIVAEELIEAQIEIMAQAAVIESGAHLLSNLSTPQRSAELRQIFRQLAKNLHPDANPDLTEEQLHLWHLAKNAYQEGDLEKLKALQIVYEKELRGLQAAIAELPEEALVLRIEVVKEGIRFLEKEIAQIRAAFPFTIETQIRDEEWVKTEVARIEEGILALRQYEGELTLEYEALINGYGGAKPELN